MNEVFPGECHLRTPAEDKMLRDLGEYLARGFAYREEEVLDHAIRTAKAKEVVRGVQLAGTPHARVP